LVVLLLIVKLYQSGLVREESDQVILDDSFSHVKTEQAQIVARIQKVEPILRTAMGLVGAATLWVIGYYVVDVMHQFK
jgi:nucleoside recognition membrane protein YjiH